MKISKAKLRQIIKEELEALQQEVRAPFPAGSRVKHEDYGEGEVKHAGTKDTFVSVLFDNPTPRRGSDKPDKPPPRSRQVSRGSLKRAE